MNVPLFIHNLWSHTVVWFEQSLSLLDRNIFYILEIWVFHLPWILFL